MDLIARGRDADVYAIGSGRVLRRYRRDNADVAGEARVMSYVRSHGYPVPEVFDADGRDLVMERLAGRSMLSVMITKPWQLRRHTRTLAELLRRLHEVPAPDWLDRTLRGVEVNSRGVDAKVLHLDLHPDNVILTAGGPVIIDWTNSAAGDPAIDVASTYLTIAAADAPVDGWRGGAISAFRAAVLRGLRSQWSDDVRQVLDDAAKIRASDPNLSAAEVSRVGDVARRWRTIR